MPPKKTGRQQSVKELLDRINSLSENVRSRSTATGATKRISPPDPPSPPKRIKFVEPKIPDPPKVSFQCIIFVIMLIPLALCCRQRQTIRRIIRTHRKFSYTNQRSRRRDRNCDAANGQGGSGQKSSCLQAKALPDIRHGTEKPHPTSAGSGALRERLLRVSVLFGAE